MAWLRPVGVRFHNLVVKPNLLDLEMRNTKAAWDRSRHTFSAKIEGPHFEELAREWARRHAAEAGLSSIGQVGTTVVSCREHRGHEVDVVALGRDWLPRRKDGEIVLLGEAKYTAKQHGIADLRRLEHIADILAGTGWQTANTAYAIFSRNGFTSELRAAGDSGAVHLLDLNDLYQPA